MTENTCYSHVSLSNKIKVGSVGQPLPLCQVKLSEKNEILIKHDALMTGYYKDKKETNNTIIDGWLYTGDQGSIDKNNFLEWRKKIGYVPQSIYLTDDVQVVSSLKDIR